MKTEQEQIEEMAKIIDEMYNVYTTTADDIAEGLYNAGYRKIDDLETENKQLKIECAVMDDELRVARQETIDMLSEFGKVGFGHEVPLKRPPKSWMYIEDLGEKE